MPRSDARAPLVELLLLLAAFGCRERASVGRVPSPATRASSAALSLAPRPAGSFTCGGDGCLQLHPRMPDTGEWLCAERGGVVWCAGSDGAAGVVAGPPDLGFRCGKRWGGGPSERVCIDRHPDYPSAPGVYQCRFQQERGSSRLCRLSSASESATSLAESALAACFLDRDCPSQRCERGTCGCASDAECRLGRCERGSCVEGQP